MYPFPKYYLRSKISYSVGIAANAIRVASIRVHTWQVYSSSAPNAAAVALYNFETLSGGVTIIDASPWHLGEPPIGLTFHSPLNVKKAESLDGHGVRSADGLMPDFLEVSFSLDIAKESEESSMSLSLRQVDLRAWLMLGDHRTV